MIQISESESQLLSHVPLFVTPWTIQSMEFWTGVGSRFSRGSSQPRDWTQVSHITGGFLPAEPWGKPKNTGVGNLFLLQQKWNKVWSIQPSVQFSSVAQLCPTLCDPMNHSTPGLPVHHHLPNFTQLTSIQLVMPSSLGSSSFSILSFCLFICSRGSQGKNTEVVCHSLLQWTTFCQTSPPWPARLGWPHGHGLVSLS